VLRNFRRHSPLRRQVRGDYVNILKATQMLGTSLGSGGQAGGLNPLYQIGGIRSRLADLEYAIQISNLQPLVSSLGLGVRATSSAERVSTPSRNGRSADKIHECAVAAD
jgi:hypothetical protein